MDGTMQEAFHEASIVSQNGSIRILKVPVVQELARNGIQDVPKVFLRPPLDTHNTAISFYPKDFPSISMARLRTKNNRAKELQKLASDIGEFGMVLVSDHGIPTLLLSGVKEVIKGFFGLSFEEKKKSVGTYACVDNMGYGRNFVTKTDDKPLDWIDRLTMKVAPTESTNGLNVWPQSPTNFREIIESYAEEARSLCDEILQALAEALGQEKNAFIKYFDPKSREIKVRINYYPPCPKPNSTMGLSPHSDASALTLLMQFDTSGGLQVMHKDKKFWLSVPWPTDALLVSAGDFLEIMTNGILKSSWHRAVTQPDLERYSMALFFNPPMSMEIEPIKSDGSGDYEYKKVVVGEYLHHYYTVIPTLPKIAIKLAMVED